MMLFLSFLPFLVMRNCFSGGKYDFILLCSPDSLPTKKKKQMKSTGVDLIWLKIEIGTDQDQVGHLETRLSPATMNSVMLRTPFSFRAETVRGAVILSTVPLKASWSFWDSTISPTHSLTHSLFLAKYQILWVVTLINKSLLKNWR